jgi:PAS domain S-box
MEIAQILIVEDDQSFADLLQFQLSTLGFQIGDSLSVQSIEEAKEASEEFTPDLILLDLNILDSHGIETYEAIDKLFSECCVFVLSGMDDQKIAEEVVSKGAQDYLLKSEIRPQILAKTIRYGLLRKSLNQELEHSEKKYRDVFNNSPLPMFKLVGENLNIQMANDACLHLYCMDNESILGKSFYDFNVDKEVRFENLNDFDSYKNEFTQKKDNGDEIIVELSLNKLEQKELSFIAHVNNKTDEILFEKNKFDIISQAEEGEKKK